MPSDTIPKTRTLSSTRRLSPRTGGETESWVSVLGFPQSAFPQQKCGDDYIVPEVLQTSGNF